MRIAKNTISFFLFLGVVFTFVSYTDVTRTVYAQASQSGDVIPTGVAPLSKRTSLLDVPVSVYPLNKPGTIPKMQFQELKEIKVFLEERTLGRKGLGISDFLSLTKSALTSGIALFKESGAQTGFNYSADNPSSDLPVNLREEPIVEVNANTGDILITLRPEMGGQLTQVGLFYDQFPDFYIVCQTSLNLEHGDRFEVSVPKDGIILSDKNNSSKQFTLYPYRFPGTNFAGVNPTFGELSLFQGDIVQINNMISETDNSNRVDVSSEAKTILGLDVVGRGDQEYFVKEIRVNFYGASLQALAPMIKQWYGSGFMPGGMGYETATFLFSPWFYNYPTDTSDNVLTYAGLDANGKPLVDAKGNPLFGNPVVMDDTLKPGVSLNLPLDNYGFPNTTFMFGMDDPRSHVTSYVSFGPRQANADMQFPRAVNQDIFQAFDANNPGGVFLYRDLGGVKGQYDPGVDHVIRLDSSKFRIEALNLSSAEIQSATSPFRTLLSRLIPSVPGTYTSGIIPFLFDDTNLVSDLLGISPKRIPKPAKEPRPPLGSVECYSDPDCLFFDNLFNIQRSFLGLTEGQVRYLAMSEKNGRTNAEDLFGTGFQMVYGFSVVLPVSKDNSIADLLVPTGRSGKDAGADIFVAVRTSEKLRNLDSVISYIQPNEIVVGTNVSKFTKGATEGVNTAPSVSSAGLGRKDTQLTSPLIGRPRPRIKYHDLTQPTEDNPSNNNVIYDRTMGSPAKPVIGMDIMDYGQNANLMDNYASTRIDILDNFFTEDTVLGQMIIEFLPSAQGVFDPAIFDAIPAALGVDILSRVFSIHSIALYLDDDTPVGDGQDNDGDGLVDEELYNLQDDDGDGLIDEDLGDADPAGKNGVYDEADKYLPFINDNFGGTRAFAEAQYVFAPNNTAKYQQYLDIIAPADTTGGGQQATYAEGTVMPLSANGTWFAELDFRALNFSVYEKSRAMIYPSKGFRPFDGTPAPDYGMPRYNMGMYSYLDPKMKLLDLVAMLRGGGDFKNFPYLPDDLAIDNNGKNLWMINLTSPSEGLIPVVGDPDGDANRTFALSMAAALRIPNPLLGFVRFSKVPMIVDVQADAGAGGEGGTAATNPTGDNIMANDPYCQFGFFIQLVEARAISDYMRSLVDPLTAAFTSARDQIKTYNDALAASQAPPAEGAEAPAAPELPTPIEVSLPDPYTAFGMTSFLEANNGNYATNYMYQVQLPDENFGPLAGDDFFLALRTSAAAQVGESFTVRLSQGALSSSYSSVDAQTGDTVNAVQPGRGVGYVSYFETTYRPVYPNAFKEQITVGPITVKSGNVPPKFTFTSPTSGKNQATKDLTFNISFLCVDPEDVPEIQLFVDDNNLDFDGAFLPGSLMQGGFNTTFTLDMREMIPNFDPTKSYYIYARVDDYVNPPVYVYSDGPITTAATVTPGNGNQGDGSSSSIVVKDSVPNYFDYVKLSSDGRAFNVGDAPKFSDVRPDGPIVDMQVTANLSGRIVLQKSGRILASGSIGTFQSRLQPNGELSFKSDEIAFYKNSLAGGSLIVSPTPGQITIESARAIAVDFLNEAIYVLDGDGDMLFLGKNAKRNMFPNPVGIDIYRDMELSPAGDQMFFLTGNGMFFTAGAASTIGTWSNLISEDKYRDMELVKTKSGVTNVLITDDDGKVIVVGPSDSTLQSLISLIDIKTIPAGSVRRVKLFPGYTKTIALMEGSGAVHIFTKDNSTIQSDTLIFADQAGIDDDRVVQMATTNINLQSVVDAVKSVINGIKTENVSMIMPYVAPDYKDKSGTDAKGLQTALQSMFDFWDVQDFSVSATNNLGGAYSSLLGTLGDPFTLSNQGDTVTANVMVDVDYWYPTMQFTQVGGDSGSTTTLAARTGILIFYPFSQSIRIQKVADGRSWTYELWKITDFGRRGVSLMTSSTSLAETDLQYLTRQLSNKIIGRYQATSAGAEAPMQVDMAVPNNTISPAGLLIIFEEKFFWQDAEPPLLSITSYLGSSNSTIFGLYDQIPFKFKLQADGTYKLVSMNLRQMIRQNQSASMPVTSGSQYNPPLSQLQGQTVNYPSGFSFAKRGVNLTVVRGDSDIWFNGTNIMPGSDKGAVMMLEEGTDIFSIEPESFIKKLNLSMVRLNPHDTAMRTTTSPETANSATFIAGRSYFVIAGDGKHFGFVQTPLNSGVSSGSSTDNTVADITFDFRYEDNWVIPDNF